MNALAPDIIKRPSATIPAPEDLDSVLASITAALARTAEHHDRTREFPAANIDLLHRHGLLGLTVPKSHGGSDASLSTVLKVVRAIARGEPSTALIVVMQYLFVQRAVRSDTWPADIRNRVLADAVEDGALANALRVEPELGTPVRGGLPATIARRVQGGWRVSGTKIFSTGAPGLTWLGVWGRTDEEKPRVGTLLLHRDFPGIQINDTWDHLGMRATCSHEVVFDNVFIPEDHAVDIRLPEQWATGFTANEASWGLTLIAAIYDAIAQNARDWLVQFLSTRIPSNLGAPLSSLPRFQEALGAIDSLLFANRTLLASAASATDRGEPISLVETNFVKLQVTNNAIDVVQRAIELTGNPGLSRHNPLERYYRDVLCSRVHSPQEDTILTGAGRQGFSGSIAKS